MILMAPCIIDFIGANVLLGHRSVQGPLPPTCPSNAFAPIKSIMHRAIRISGQ
jgi:hypothetical protein